MLLYYIVLIIIIAFHFIVKRKCVIDNQKFTNKQKKTFLLLSFGLMIALSALKRTDVGTDTVHYLDAYNWLSVSGINGRYEIGFAILSRFVAKFFGNYQMLIAISSLIMFVPFAIYIYYYSESVTLSTLLVYFSYFISFNTMMRQAMAMGVGVIALIFLRRKKYLFYILFSFLAYSFHKSAIIIAVFPIIFGLNYRFSSFVMLAIGAFLLGRIDYIRTLMRALSIDVSYINDAGAGGLNAVLLTLISLMQMLLFYSISKRNDRDDQGEFMMHLRNYKFEFWSLYLYVILNILTISMPVLSRFGDYFVMGLLTFLPNKITETNKPIYKFNVCIIVILMYILYQTLVFIYRPLWGGVFPYHFFWQIS